MPGVLALLVLAHIALVNALPQPRPANVITPSSADKGADPSYITELVAMVPTLLGVPGNPPQLPNVPTTLQWANLTYPTGVASVDDVQLSLVSDPNPDLGAWQELDAEGAVLTAKAYDDMLYVLQTTEDHIADTGCCAQRLRAYPKDGSNFTDYYPLELLEAPGFVAAMIDPGLTHTLVITHVDGARCALMILVYRDPLLGVAHTNALIMLNLETGELVPTVDGSMAWLIFQGLGTLKTDPADSRFKVGYYNMTEYNFTTSGDREMDEWHTSGLERFTTKDGTAVLVLTQKAAFEAVVLRDPWVYSQATERGGTILQRFGTPPDLSEETAHRFFGLDPDGPAISVAAHNVHYQSSSATFGGAESLTIFANRFGFDQNLVPVGPHSSAIEFQIKFVEEGSPEDPGDDTVFDTNYVVAALPFFATYFGGARSIGDSIFLASTGGMMIKTDNGNAPGFVVASVKNESAPKRLGYLAGVGQSIDLQPDLPDDATATFGLYDPYVVVRV